MPVVSGPAICLLVPSSGAWLGLVRHVVSHAHRARKADVPPAAPLTPRRTTDEKLAAAATEDKSVERDGYVRACRAAFYL
jgi:hypothetical protein